MREHCSLFMLIVLLLAMVIPMAASADFGSATATPIPIMATATPTPISDEDIVCVDMATVEEAAAGSHEIFDRLGYSEVPDFQTMEEFRRQLLDIVDTVDELSDELPPAYPRLPHIKNSLQVQRKRIQELTHEELNLIYRSSPDHEVVKISLKSAKSTLLVSRRGANEKDQGPGNGDKGSGPTLSSFTIIPRPTPVSTPNPPSITHKNHESTNAATGDLFPPGWPTDIGCPEQGYPTEVLFGMMIGLDVMEEVGIALDAWCKEKTISCPGVNAQDPIQCTIESVYKFIYLAVKDVYEGFNFCNGGSVSARIQAIYEDSKIIHADLAQHDANLTTRFNLADQFLFDFRNLNLRLNIEANLASPDDDPHALLTLPRAVCISEELETLQQTEPFAPEVIAGCGLLEVVRDTVQSAIEMTEVNESVNNAWAEFDAAVEHYNNHEWKLSYARFRKAYREAVRP